MWTAVKPYALVSRGLQLTSLVAYQANFSVEGESAHGEDFAKRHDDVADEEQLKFSAPNVSCRLIGVEDFH